MGLLDEAEGDCKFTFWPHYNIIQLKNMDDVREIFPEGEADTLNWLFLSTSGIHGDYMTLDDYETPEKYFHPDELEECATDFLTVLIVHTRLVVLRYGQIKIKPEDVPYLRKLVNSTMLAVKESQEGNL